MFSYTIGSRTLLHVQQDPTGALRLHRPCFPARTGLLSPPPAPGILVTDSACSSDRIPTRMPCFSRTGFSPDRTPPPLHPPPRSRVQVRRSPLHGSRALPHSVLPHRLCLFLRREPPCPPHPRPAPASFLRTAPLSRSIQFAHLEKHPSQRSGCLKDGEGSFGGQQDSLLGSPLESICFRQVSVSC